MDVVLAASLRGLQASKYQNEACLRIVFFGVGISACMQPSAASGQLVEGDCLNGSHKYDAPNLRTRLQALSKEDARSRHKASS